MTNRIFDAISGIGILIAIFLFLNNGRDTTSIINSIASNTTAGIKVLQGR
jgi:hypothetical protein